MASVTHPIVIKSFRAILDSGLRSVLSRVSREMLEHHVSSNDEFDIDTDGYVVYFQTSKYETGISVKSVTDYNIHGGDGNVYDYSTVTFNVFWRAYDSRDTQATDEAVDLIQKTNELAKSLTSKFGSEPVRRLVRAAVRTS